MHLPAESLYQNRLQILRDLHERGCRFAIDADDRFVIANLEALPAHMQEAVEMCYAGLEAAYRMKKEVMYEEPAAHYPDAFDRGCWLEGRCRLYKVKELLSTKKLTKAGGCGECDMYRTRLKHRRSEARSGAIRKPKTARKGHLHYPDESQELEI